MKQLCTAIAVADIAGDTTALTEFESLIDADVKALKQTGRVEEVAEAGEFVCNCFLEWVAARSGWVGGIQVIRTWNQLLCARGEATTRLRLCHAHEEQSHHQRRQTHDAPTHFFFLNDSVGDFDFRAFGSPFPYLSFSVSSFWFCLVRSVSCAVLFLLLQFFWMKKFLLLQLSPS